MTTDVAKKQRYGDKIKEYMDRAEALKKCLEDQQASQYICISNALLNNRISESYKKLYNVGYACNMFKSTLSKLVNLLQVKYVFQIQKYMRKFTLKITLSGTRMRKYSANA